MADERKQIRNPWESPRAGGASPGRAYRGFATLAAVALLVAATLLVYWGGVFGEFLGPDHALFQRSPFLDAQPAAADSGSAIPHWLPRATTVVSLALDRSLWGPLPAGFRTSNLVLHVLATLAALALFLEWTGRRMRIALPAALLFAVHPIHIEAVERAGARGEILAALFTLLSLTLLGRARRESAIALPVSLGLFFIATFASPIALLVPIFVILADIAIARNLGSAARSNGVQWALFLAAALPSAVLWMLVSPPAAPQNRWLMGRAALDAVRLLLLPFPLSTYRIIGPARGIDQLSILALLLAVGLFIGTWILIRLLLARADTPDASATRVALARGALFALVPVAALAIVPPFPPGPDVPFALLEPSLYLPAAGIVVVLACVLEMLADLARSRAKDDAPNRRVAAIVLLVLVVAVPFAAMVLLRYPVFKDDAVMYAAAATQEPRSIWLRVQLALSASAHGHPDQAIQVLAPVVAQQPSDADLHLILGNLYRDVRDTEKAEKEIREALRLKPSLATAHNTLGLIERDRGNVAGAENEYREAVRLDPTFADAHNNLGALLVVHGAQDEAMAEFRRAVELDPTLGDAAANLASFLIRQNLQDDALAVLRRGLLYSEGDARLHYHVGVVLRRRGERAAAMDSYKRALALDPSYARPMNNLAVLLTEQKHYEEAIALLNRVSELEPQNEQAHYNLGIAYRLSGDRERAAAEFGRALRLRPDYPEASRALSEMASGEGSPPAPTLPR